MSDGAGSHDDKNYAVLLEILLGGERPKNPAELKTDQLRALADNLWRDLTKLRCLMQLPIFCVGNARLQALVEVMAHFKITKDLSAPRPPDDALNLEIQGLRDAAMADEGVVYADALREWQRILEGAEADSGIQLGTDALSEALILWTYTIVESLSTDLWLEAVNLRPRTLAVNVINSDAFEDEEAERKRPKPSIALEALAPYGFNLTTCMGQLLKDKKQVSFESFKGVEAAYCAAFLIPESKKKRLTSKGLIDIFEPHRKTIKHLECVRNLIAHKGGRVDAKFLRQLSNLKISGATYTEKKPYPIRPSEIGSFAFSALTFTTDLLAFVDNWLCRYPDPPPSK